MPWVLPHEWSGPEVSYLVSKSVLSRLAALRLTPSSPAESSGRVAVAPLMGWTHRHFRYLLRCVSPSVVLFTEMIPSAALVHGRKTQSLLSYHSCEHPIALQLAGDCPDQLANAARIGHEYGYDEINLNVGCPSPRVQRGGFGVCLMAQPERLAECVRAIRSVNPVPVTIKCRLGFDEHHSDHFLDDFVAILSEAGCSTFYVHARMAWLQGLDPKENREKPPLNYSRVDRLKKKFKDLEIILNGGIRDLEQVVELLSRFDGVMVGRRVLEDPLWLAEVDQRLGRASRDIRTREAVVLAYVDYLRKILRDPGLPGQGRRSPSLFQPLGGLFRSFPGAAKMRAEAARASQAAPSELLGWLDRLEKWAEAGSSHLAPGHPYRVSDV